MSQCDGPFCKAASGTCCCSKGPFANPENPHTNTVEGGKLHLLSSKLFKKVKTLLLNGLNLLIQYNNKKSFKKTNSWRPDHLLINKFSMIPVLTLSKVMTLFLCSGSAA
jgi:hypothetical protein